MRYFSLLIVFSLIFAFGCTNKEAGNSLEEGQLVHIDEYNDLKNKTEELETEIGKLKNAEHELEEQLDLLSYTNEINEQSNKAYKNLIRYIEENSNVLYEQLGLFSYDLIQEGDTVAGLTIDHIEIEEYELADHYFINFDGEFKINGSIIVNQGSSPKYAIMIEEGLENIPHTLYDYERNKIFFVIKNGEKLEEIMGEQLKELDDTSSIEINATFKNFSYNHVPETDVQNSAEFVSLK